MHKDEDDNISYDPSRVVGAHDEGFDDDGVEYAEESVVASGVPREEHQVVTEGASIDLSKEMGEKETSPKAKAVKYVILALVLGVVATAIGLIVHKEVTNKKDVKKVVCEWDGGDCAELNDYLQKYPNCSALQNWYESGFVNPSLGNDICDDFYNTESCGWELGDCDLYNSLVNCTGAPHMIGDGTCHTFGEYNTEECGFDGGDCDEFNEKYPNCDATDPLYKVGDGNCDSLLNTEACGFDDGDCTEFNEKYPNCDAYFPEVIGDGKCQSSYNTEACGFDGGDCTEFNEKYPDCDVSIPENIGDDFCHGGEYNTEACGFDGGDCAEFNAKYPNCDVDLPGLVGDGDCDTSTFGENYNTTECGYDGGDCTEFNDCNGVDTTYEPEIIPQSVDVEDPVSLAAAIRCGAALQASGFNFFDFLNYDQWFDEDSILYLPETGYYKGPEDISEYVAFTISDMFEYYYPSVPGSPIPLVADGDTCAISYATANSMAAKEMYSSIEDNPSADTIVGFRVSFNITSPDLSTINVSHVYLYYPPGFLEFLFDGILGGESVARRNCMILESACSDTFYNKNGYGEVDECVSDLMALPRSDGDKLDGNTLKCRTLHADFAAINDKHCPHISIIPEYDEKCFLKCQESANKSIEDAFHPVELAFFKSFSVAAGLGEKQFMSPTIFGPPSS